MKPTQQEIDYLESKERDNDMEYARRGNLIAVGLNLKRDAEYPDRWVTQWGTKTDLGLFRTLKRFIKEGFPV